MRFVSREGYFFVELYVGMGKMVAWWHQYALGFRLKGKREQKGEFGMEITYWLQKGSANLLITSALEPAAHDVVSFIDRHGNSIKRFAILVSDSSACLEHLRENGAIFMRQGLEEIRHGEEWASLIRCKLFDDNEVLFVEKGESFGPLPGFVPVENDTVEVANSTERIDHLASVVRVNESDFWNNYLCRLLNMNHLQTIGEEFFANLSTGMKMHVLHSAQTKLNKVIVEPLPEKTRYSQVDVFLQHHFGTGIQHLAFEVGDLAEVVRNFSAKGVKFTQVPERYYQDLRNEFPELPIDLMQQCNILCEKDGDKILLQVFTEPIGDRPTLFYEFIQRVNEYDGFGANNVRQLFKSLEVQLNGEA
jgi:4-hydroxyphenylpyruvate dioxygenase